VRRISCALAVVLGLLVSGPNSAQASWQALGTRASTASATTVNRPAAPVVTKVGVNAQVSWTATTLAQGTAVTGYTVLRKVGATTITLCTTTAPTATCVDTAPVQTTAEYSVIARYRGWASQESTRTAFTFDTVAPVTTAAATGTPNGAGWIRAASSNVTLTATDAGSGVASIRYKIGSAAAVTVNAASTNFAVNAQGTTTITYAATDNAGNVEADKTLVVKLDNVAPTAAMTFPTTAGPFNAAQWGTNCRTSANAPVAGVCGTTIDTASGTDNVQYELKRTWYLFGFIPITRCWNGSAFANSCGTYRDAADGPTAGSWLITLPYTEIDDSNYEFELRLQATDVAGNAMPATLVRSWDQ